MTNETANFKEGQWVKDRDGFIGTVRDVVWHDGNVHYVMRLDRGCAVRFNADLTAIQSPYAKAS